MKEQIKPSPEKESSTIDRRKMLKTTLALGGAITAAAFLEGKWLKPVVKSGILPVHAQSSCAFIWFYPHVIDNDPNLSSGTAHLTAVAAFDYIPENPITITPLKVSGPISYQILSYTGFAALTPTAGKSGTMTDGIWVEGSPPSYPPIETFTYTDVEEIATVTVRWTFSGCAYTYTYDIGWAP